MTQAFAPRTHPTVAAICSNGPPDPLLAASSGASERAPLLTADELERLAWTTTFAPHPAQAPPAGDAWRFWLFLGGRGAGKTRAGAEWVRAEVESGRARRVALIGPTLGDVREVMIEGPSGLHSIADEKQRPNYSVTRRRLLWPDICAEAFAFSAEDPDSLRGPQFDLAWCDEAGAWRRGEAVWDTLRFGLRLGSAPRVLVTTTPRPTPLVRRLVRMCERGDGVMTRAATHANAGNLAPGFIETLEGAYAGTRLRRQELLGELIEEAAGALFARETIENGRLAPHKAPVMDRVVVAVDPPAGSGPSADACGIVAAGLAAGCAYVLEDASISGLAPLDWARRVAALARQRGAGRIIAEANQGGEMVRAMLTIAQADARVVMRHALKSKRDRAEPVSGWYAQGRVRHVGVFQELEDEMATFGADGGRSPDRMDALVWAISDLLQPPRVPPSVRSA